MHVPPAPLQCGVSDEQSALVWHVQMNSSPMMFTHAPERHCAFAVQFALPVSWHVPADEHRAVFALPHWLCVSHG